MRTRNYFVAVIAALGSFSLMAADVEVKANTDSPKVETEVRRDNDAHNYKQEVRIESPVKAINRAHNLIGMEIRNRNDEKLGEIKDLVIDLQSGKVAYATIASGGFIGVGEKLIAVPLSALTPSERSDKYLILDATKGELMDAPGIAQTNWPDYRNPNYNESPFFHPKARGSAAANESGKAKLYTDAEHHDKNVKIESNINHDNRDRDHVAMGRIKSVSGDQVIIENAGRTETYTIHNNSIRASDYKNGDRVTLKYHTDSNGRMVIDDLTRQ
jgi:sporulation protein YlmC with PRC-barrel domain